MDSNYQLVSDVEKKKNVAVRRRHNKKHGVAPVNGEFGDFVLFGNVLYDEPTSSWKGPDRVVAKLNGWTYDIR